MLVLDSSEGCVYLPPCTNSCWTWPYFRWTEVLWRHVTTTTLALACHVPCPVAVEGSHFKFWWWLRVDDAGIFGNWWWFECELNDSWPPAWAEQLLTFWLCRPSKHQDSIDLRASSPILQTLSVPLTVRKASQSSFSRTRKNQQTYKKRRCLAPWWKHLGASWAL